MNDENASTRRVLKYCVPVLLFSVAFNLPKFFEAEIGHLPVSANETVPIIRVTELRLNKAYSLYYNNIARLIVLGIAPFALLVFFNTKIYQDIQVRTMIYVRAALGGLSVGSSII